MMKRNMPAAPLPTALSLAVAAMALTLSSVNAGEPTSDDGGHRMQLTSTTFTNDSTLPASAVHDIQVPGTTPGTSINACTVDGGPGGNQSPELAWSHAPHDTRTFVVVLYDTTAAFTHWGMYNIDASTSELPENAGVPASTFGTQIVNDFSVEPSGARAAQYDGPCPPPNFPPNVHHYVFTVYALDTRLTLSGSPNFPAAAETLYHALIQAGRDGHILDSASLTGLYSTTPP
jgi:Raf kinase inhibitor-like YbhB/YbcL family protein